MKLKIGKIVVPYSLRFEEGYKYFKSFGTEEAEQDKNLPFARIGDFYWNDLLSRGFENSSVTEVSHLAAPVSEYLLAYHCCLIHAVAFSFRGQAWLIVAPSGTGKSTQVCTLMQNWPEEVSVICGDRPALEFVDDKTVQVHPTPWNGKENWFGAPSAPLKGLIVLKRGDQDDATPLRPAQAVLEVYSAMIQSSCDAAVVHQICACTDQLMKNASIWKLQSNTIDGAAQILYHKIICGEDIHEI